MSGRLSRIAAVVAGVAASAACENVVRPPAREVTGGLVVRDTAHQRFSHIHISNPTGDCVEISGAQDVELDDVQIGPCGGRGIYVHDASRVVIRHSTISPRSAPRPCCDRATGILASHVARLAIIDSDIESAESLVEILGGEDIEIASSELRDPHGPRPRGQLIQLQEAADRVSIHDNKLTCDAARGCNQEDAINVYSASHVTIVRNSIEGGTSGTGCGVLVDGFGARDVTVRANQIARQTDGHGGGCGIGVAGGTDLTIEDNTVSGYGNVAFYVWAQPKGTECARVRFAGNRAGPGQPRSSAPWFNAFWDGGGCAEVTVRQNSWSYSPPR